mgnify:CR=1 FL=1
MEMSKLFKAAKVVAPLVITYAPALIRIAKDVKQAAKDRKDRQEDGGSSEGREAPLRRAGRRR